MVSNWDDLGFPSVGDGAVQQGAGGQLQRGGRSAAAREGRGAAATWCVEGAEVLYNVEGTPSRRCMITKVHPPPSVPKGGAGKETVMDLTTDLDIAAAARMSEAAARRRGKRPSRSSSSTLITISSKQLNQRGGSSDGDGGGAVAVSIMFKKDKDKLDTTSASLAPIRRTVRRINTLLVRL